MVVEARSRHLMPQELLREQVEVSAGLSGANKSGGTITASYATGAVTGMSDDVGGLVGFTSSGTITASYATGNVTSTGAGDNTGGLVGYNNGSTIEASYATGAVTGTTDVGGLVGENTGTISGTNYFVDTTIIGGGSNGIGNGTCGGTCTQDTLINLRDTLDETLDAVLNWDAELDSDGSPYWGNLNASGFPCLRNMPPGAPTCN